MVNSDTLEVTPHLARYARHLSHGLIFTHIFGWIQVCRHERFQPQRGDLTQPRPTAWVKKFIPPTIPKP